MSSQCSATPGSFLWWRMGKPIAIVAFTDVREMSNGFSDEKYRICVSHTVPWKKRSTTCRCMHCESFGLPEYGRRFLSVRQIYIQQRAFFQRTDRIATLTKYMGIPWFRSGISSGLQHTQGNRSFELLISQRAPALSPSRQTVQRCPWVACSPFWRNRFRSSWSKDYSPLSSEAKRPQEQHPSWRACSCECWASSSS